MLDQLLDFLDSHLTGDASHGRSHAKRVLKMAREIASTEYDVDDDVIMASAILHDVVALPKDHPDRNKSSLLAADKASNFLKTIEFPQHKIEAVAHSILTHSFSAGIIPETIEAKILQDADRMEALGAIGIARCFYTSGLLKRNLFHSEDPLAKDRDLDDREYALDHFYVKLLKLPSMMQTEGGMKMAQKKADILKRYIDDLLKELNY